MTNALSALTLSTNAVDASPKIVFPEMVFGFHGLDHWIPRYCRFRASLSSGSHRFLGYSYNPAGADLIGNELQVIINGALVGRVTYPEKPEWQAFCFSLPEISQPQVVNIVMRCTKFRVLPLDQRILGVLVKGLYVEIGSV